MPEGSRKAVEADDEVASVIKARALVDNALTTLKFVLQLARLEESTKSVGSSVFKDSR